MIIIHYSMFVHFPCGSGWAWRVFCKCMYASTFRKHLRNSLTHCLFLSSFESAFKSKCGRTKMNQASVGCPYIPASNQLCSRCCFMCLAWSIWHWQTSTFQIFEDWRSGSCIFSSHTCLLLSLWAGNAAQRLMSRLTDFKAQPVHDCEGTPAQQQFHVPEQGGECS